MVLLDNRFVQPVYSRSMPEDWFDSDVKELVSERILKDSLLIWAVSGVSLDLLISHGTCHLSSQSRPERTRALHPRSICHCAGLTSLPREEEAPLAGYGAFWGPPCLESRDAAS